MPPRHPIIPLVALSLASCSRTGLVVSERDTDASGDRAVVDAPIDACGPSCTILPPRPIAPLSTSTVTSHRPEFRWALATDIDGARLEIFRDRACTISVTEFVAAGDHAVLPSPLAPGLYYWRVRGTHDGVVGASTSAVWQFWVGPRDTATNTSWGTVPDFDGDGLAEILVGAPGDHRDSLNRSHGRIYVYPGRAGGLPANVPTVLEGSGASDEFGSFLASAGDVDGDGFADLLVSEGGLRRVLVFHGSARGIRTEPVARIEDPGSEPMAFFGYRVASAGDVDRDGYADVLISAWDAHWHGAAYLYRGGPSGLGAQPDTTWAGPEEMSAFGENVAGGGDVNGDGFADVVVWAETAAEMHGRAYVYPGSAAGVATMPASVITGPGVDGDIGAGGDVNGDGYADLVIVADNEADPGAGALHLGGPAGIHAEAASRFHTVGPLYEVSVSASGDVNGDGFADTLAGVWSDPRVGPTQLYFVAGGPDGFSPAPVVLRAPSSGGFFGLHVAHAGDVNGDGFGDVVVGAYGAGVGGRAYVYPGGAAGLDGIPAVILEGVFGTETFGWSVALRDVTGANVGGCGLVSRPGC